ncbi:MAG: hypothetical protein Alis3KO_21830 [Aliiglaciecola sp.]|uniref:hypothetical protein n=1 Tax=Aliiglaciecola sp. M165 TaxID=2593649 RepID=UPI00118128E9|nr:hypothetical protein [Aliiglaciecola sp. M165]TRY30894.1 hypothetical protein FM019_13515 [Aliiglaciecola sp. M165]
MNLTAIFVIGIICWTIVKLTGKDKKSIKQSPDQIEENNQLKNEVAALKERVATLEAIVTDDKYNLRREIDSLGKNRAA